jgi:hypothetical protein
MSSPPPISKYRIPTRRFTNRNNGPSSNVRNYEPELEDHALLMNGSYNYKENAKKRQAEHLKAFNWGKFMNKKNGNTRKANNKNNSKKNKSNSKNQNKNTRRVLFKR